MKIAAGLIGILIGVFSLGYVGIYGGIVGSAASWLGSFGPAGNDVSSWAETVKILSWLGPCLVLIGGGIAFANPMLGGIFMSFGAFALWYLLGFGSIGNDFIIPSGGAAVLAFVAAFLEFEEKEAEAGPRVSDVRFEQLPTSNPAVLIRCTSCNHANPQDAKFCSGCGTATVSDGKVCTSCGARNSQNAKFCKNCAARVEPPTEVLAIPPSEQKIVEQTTMVYGKNSNPPLDADPPHQSEAPMAASFVPSSDTMGNFESGSQNAFQDWRHRAEAFAKERPYIAIGIVSAVIILLVGLVAGGVWIAKSPTTLVAATGTSQKAGESSGTLYATRLTHIRNAPTSIGSATIGDLQAGQSVSGTWMLGHDGVTMWLHVKQPDGNDGFIWGRNLSPSQSFDDPQTYCQTVRTIDQPGGNYRGPVVPDWIYTAMHRSKSDGGYIAWRCEGGAVLACQNGGITGPCDKKDVNRRPTQAMFDWCRENPSSSDIPAATTGHDTVYAWYCQSNQPRVGRQFSFPDQNGFSPDEWVTVSKTP